MLLNNLLVGLSWIWVVELEGWAAVFFLLLLDEDLSSDTRISSDLNSVQASPVDGDSEPAPVGSVSQAQPSLEPLQTLLYK